MDQFVYRDKVRILAYIDIGLSGCTLALGLTFMLFALFVTSVVKDVAANTEDADVISDTSAALTILWIIIVLMIVSEVVKIVAALKLLKACKVDNDPKISYDLCKFWRNVNIEYVALMAIAMVIESNYRIGYLINLILYCAALYMVHRYMQELLTVEWIPNSDPIMMNENGGQMEAPGNYEEEHAFGSMPPPQYSSAKGQEQW